MVHRVRISKTLLWISVQDPGFRNTSIRSSDRERISTSNPESAQLRTGCPCALRYSWLQRDDEVLASVAGVLDLDSKLRNRLSTANLGRPSVPKRPRLD